MNEKNDIEERCHKILEDNGAPVAEKAARLLLEDPDLKNFRRPFEFVSNNWRDLTPAFMSLSCEALRGQPKKTYDASLAMSLINLSFYILDDIIDNAHFKSFRPTLLEKYGQGTALIIGGLLSAKAFSILNTIDMEKEKCQAINKLVFQLWVQMAHTEITVLGLRKHEFLSSKSKLWKIKSEAIDFETWFKIGAVIGNGSEDEARRLVNYGRCLGIISELRKDFLVSTNLTIELEGKIKNRALPYSLLWASEHSERVQRALRNLLNKEGAEKIDIKQIVDAFLETEALNNVLEAIKRLAQQGKKALDGIQKNEAVEALLFYIEAQPQLFAKSLSSMQTQ
jgi:geranylgeranyl pyrophosphate synthase